MNYQQPWKFQYRDMIENKNIYPCFSNMSSDWNQFTLLVTLSFETLEESGWAHIVPWTMAFPLPVGCGTAAKWSRWTGKVPSWQSARQDIVCGLKHGKLISHSSLSTRQTTFAAWNTELQSYRALCSPWQYLRPGTQEAGNSLVDAKMWSEPAEVSIK